MQQWSDQQQFAQPQWPQQGFPMQTYPGAPGIPMGQTPPQYPGLPQPTYGGPPIQQQPNMPPSGGPFIPPAVASPPSKWKLYLGILVVVALISVVLYYTGTLAKWWAIITNPRWAMNVTTCTTADAAAYLNTLQSASEPPQNLNILCDLNDIADYTYRAAGPQPAITSGCYGQQMQALYEWGQNPNATPMPVFTPCTAQDYKVYLTNLAYWQKMQGAPLNNTNKYTSIYINPDGTIATAAQIAANSAEWQIANQQSASSTAILSG